MQLTSQLPVDVQVTTLPSPTVGAQSFTLVHVYVQSAPHVAPHVLVPEHVTVHRSPHETLQLGPLEHENVQSSEHTAAQSASKLLHVGAHALTEPQSRRPQPAPLQPHVSELHGMVTVVPMQASAPATNASVTTTGARRYEPMAGDARERSSRPSRRS